MSAAEKTRLREEFMNEFDENRDGRIEMAEVGFIIYLASPRQTHRQMDGRADGRTERRIYEQI